MMRAYLQRIIARCYGALVDRALGSLKPGLNVVLGPNEAGKSTFASLVGGVLFGWDDRRGVANTYRPEEGEREGSLEFCSLPTEAEFDSEPTNSRIDSGIDSDINSKTNLAFTPEALLLSRKGCESLQGDTQLLSDIDAGIYRTLFSLTSDELMSLRGSSNITARLFAVSSGTAESPVDALETIEERITELACGSIPELETRIDDLRAKIRANDQQTETIKQQDRELRESMMNQKDMAKHADDLERELQDLKKLRKRIEEYDLEERELDAERASLLKEQSIYQEQAGVSHSFDDRLMGLDTVQEHALLGRIDEFENRRDKLQRMQETAKQNSDVSNASYEALVEMNNESSPEQQKRFAFKGSQVAISIIPTLVFAILGVALFLYGRHLPSLSFTVFGIGLVALAFFLAAAGAVLVFRPDRSVSELETRIRDAQWIMLQDKKKLDATTSDITILQDEIKEFLENEGLGSADGSLRQARVLLEGAAAVRAELAVNDQRLTAIAMRLESNSERLQSIQAERSEALQKALLFADQSIDPISEIDDQINEKSQQHAALIELIAQANLRIGELKALTKAALNDHSRDYLKLEWQQAVSCLREAKHELIELLLAKRMLERSLTVWENRSKPQVYARASKLLEEITNGRWVEVSLASTGSVVAIDHQGSEVKPRHLSLGTRQQLYLALRVALLIEAQNMGRSIPILADDILVNFDPERRIGAARVLARLAEERQVIVFTSHPETATALREVAPSAHLIELL